MADMLVNGDMTVTGTLIANTFSNVPRGNLQQDTQVYSIPFSQLRVWNDFNLLLPSAGATDDLGIVEGTFGTNFPTLQTEDLKAEAGNPTLNYAAFLFSMPAEYVDAGNFSINIVAGMTTTVADDAATVDVELYLSDEDNTVTGDLVTTAAQSINSLTPATKTFSVTGSSCVSGSDVIVRIATSVSDGATGTDVIATIYKISLSLPVKG